MAHALSREVAESGVDLRNGESTQGTVGEAFHVILEHLAIDAKSGSIDASKHALTTCRLPPPPARARLRSCRG